MAGIRIVATMSDEDQAVPARVAALLERRHNRSRTERKRRRDDVGCGRNGTPVRMSRSHHDDETTEAAVALLELRRAELCLAVVEPGDELEGDAGRDVERGIERPMVQRLCRHGLLDEQLGRFPSRSLNSRISAIDAASRMGGPSG